MAAKQEADVLIAIKRKPFKVSASNRNFKGVVAATLSELKSAASKSLEITSREDVRVFLDEDLTEVDDEDYFQFLPAQSKFVILTDRELRSISRGIADNERAAFSVAHLERSESQITRSQGHDVTDAGFMLDQKTRERITNDPTFFVSLGDDELEKVIALDTSKACQELGKTKEEVLLYQESCERELSRRSELRDATELLKLYQKAKGCQNIDNSTDGAKRKKMS